MADERARADRVLAVLKASNAAESYEWPAVADRVREARERIGLRENEVATRLGISSSEYQDIELHDDEAFTCFSVAHLRHLAGVLGVRLEMLLFGPDCMVDTRRTSFGEVTERLSAYARREGLTIDQLGDRVGWELSGVIADPEEIGNLNVVGLYDICVPIGVDWVTVLLGAEPDRPTTA